MNRHNLTCYSDLCPTSSNVEEIQLEVIEVPILGKTKPGHKAYPRLCSNEECTKAATVTCDLYLKYLKS